MTQPVDVAKPRWGEQPRMPQLFVSGVAANEVTLLHHSLQLPATSAPTRPLLHKQRHARVHAKGATCTKTYHAVEGNAPWDRGRADPARRASTSLSRDVTIGIRKALRGCDVPRPRGRDATQPPRLHTSIHRRGSTPHRVALLQRHPLHRLQRGGGGALPLRQTRRHVVRILSSSCTRRAAAAVCQGLRVRKKQHLVKREEYRLQGCDARAWGNLPLPASVRRSGSRPRGSPLCGLVGHDEPGATRSLTTGRCTSRQVDRCDLRHLGGVCALGSEKTLGHWVRPSSGAALSCRCTGRPCVVWTHPNLVGRASCALHSRHRFRSHRGHSALKSKSGHSTVMNQFSGLAPPPAAVPLTAPRPPRR